MGHIESKMSAAELLRAEIPAVKSPASSTKSANYGKASSLTDDPPSGWKAIWKVGDVGKTCPVNGYQIRQTFYRVVQVNESELYAVCLKKQVQSGGKAVNGWRWQFVRPGSEAENNQPVIFRFGVDEFLDLRSGVSDAYRDSASMATMWFYDYFP